MRRNNTDNRCAALVQNQYAYDEGNRLIRVTRLSDSVILGELARPPQPAQLVSSMTVRYREVAYAMSDECARS